MSHSQGTVYAAPYTSPRVLAAYAPVMPSMPGLVDSATFRNFAERARAVQTTALATAASASAVPTYDHSYCEDCRIPLQHTGPACAECPKCHRIYEGVTESTTHENSASSSIRRTSKKRGVTRYYHYSITSDYSKTQRQQIFEQLNNNNNTYAGPKFSRDVLQRVATTYNDIQKSANAGEVLGNVAPGKKFVRRGNIKDQILCALIHYECIRAGCTRKKKDIADMMRMPVNGFSEGDSIVRTLNCAGVISLPIDTEPFADFVYRYMEALGIDAAQNADTLRLFVLDIVGASEREKIGMNSQLSSKVVGALWAAIVAWKLPITSAALERASDNIKKSTFMKFYKCVLAEREVFGPIYEQYGVKLP